MDICQCTFHRFPRGRSFAYELETQASRLTYAHKGILTTLLRQSFNERISFGIVGW